MSEMCFDDFDYDRHPDNCECEECIKEEIEKQELPRNCHYCIGIFKCDYFYGDDNCVKHNKEILRSGKEF